MGDMADYYWDLALVAADIRTHILHAVAQAGDARDKALERLRADAEHSRA